MSRFPSPTLADRMGDRIQELDDGFVRLGDDDTPFTLREGGEPLQQARQLHSERGDSERDRDEESNEPVTRALSEWRAKMTELDFPFVDTIPLDEQRRRANRVAALATEEGIVDRVDRDVAFDDEAVRGRYWRGIDLIEIGTDSDDFPGFQTGVVLAHEVGCVLRCVESGQWNRRAPSALQNSGYEGAGSEALGATSRADDRNGRTVR